MAVGYELISSLLPLQQRVFSDSVPPRSKDSESSVVGRHTLPIMVCMTRDSPIIAATASCRCGGQASVVIQPSRVLTATTQERDEIFQPWRRKTADARL